MTTRPAEKAGYWYKSEASVLKNELQGYLAAVPDTVDGAPLPIAGARVIIAP
jgi:MEMO1 family protein